jgi:hypothetical protein
MKRPCIAATSDDVLPRSIETNVPPGPTSKIDVYERSLLYHE